MTARHVLTLVRERGRRPWRAACSCGQFAARRRLKKSAVRAYHLHTAKAAHAAGHDPRPVPTTPADQLPEALR